MLARNRAEAERELFLKFLEWMNEHGYRKAMVRNVEALFDQYLSEMSEKDKG